MGPSEVPHSEERTQSQDLSPLVGAGLGGGMKSRANLHLLRPWGWPMLRRPRPPWAQLQAKNMIKSSSAWVGPRPGYWWAYEVDSYRDGEQLAVENLFRDGVLVVEGFKRQGSRRGIRRGFMALPTIQHGYRTLGPVL